MAEQNQNCTWVDEITANRPALVKNKPDIPYTTFPKVIREYAQKYSDTVQYITADGQEYSLGEFYELSKSVAKSLVSLGLQPFDGVAIHGLNSVEWFAIDIGASLCATIPAGIYTTNKADIVAYILDHANVKVLFIDDDEAAMQKVLSVRDKFSSELKIVMWGDAYEPLEKFPNDYHRITKWDDFLKLHGAEDVTDEKINKLIELPQPGSACKLIYTSGTTGPPKGVIIGQDNAVFTGMLLGQILKPKESRHRLVSYLPCSHIAANLSDIFGAIINRATVYIADKGALKGTLTKTLRKARPTVFVAVPRVFEKIQEQMLAMGSHNGPFKTVLVRWAKDVGRRKAEAVANGNDANPWGYNLAKLLVFRNLRKALGLDAAEVIITTSAPLQKSTEMYFKQFDFKIVDLYGMSEATGPFTLNYPEYRAGTSGKPLAGIEVKLVRKISDNEGELAFRGRNMFLGYLKNAEESAKAMDDEGFVHSGDIGKIDEDGFISITGRAKELIITAGGENVAPIPLESSLVSSMPAMCRAFVIGDKLKFISALLIPFMKEDGSLIGPALDVNPEVKTAKQAVDDPVWKEYIETGIKTSNDEAISNAAKVKAFRLLPRDFTVEADELTPSLKVKRKVIVQKYADLISSMYE